jgi:hypothetical protein
MQRCHEGKGVGLQVLQHETLLHGVSSVVAYIGDQWSTDLSGPGEEKRAGSACTGGLDMATGK